MSSLNKVTLIGHLGRDPETRYTPDGKAATNFSVATSETWKDANGNKQESTEWHRITAFGKLAEVVSEHLRKGSLVYLEGKLRTRKWQDKDGHDRYTTEINIFEMKMLGGKREESGNTKPEKQQSKRDSAEDDQDIPF